MQAGRSYFDKDTPTVVLRSLFSKYDTDGNGVLGVDELNTLLKEDLGLTSEQADIYSLVIDKDGSRSISFDEFASWLRSGERFSNVSDISKYQQMCKAVEIFRQFDTDGNETIEKTEFSTLMSSINYKENEIEKAFKQLDKNGDGVISFFEFLAWISGPKKSKKWNPRSTPWSHTHVNVTSVTQPTMPKSKNMNLP